jgi:hypothetical protein
MKKWRDAERCFFATSEYEKCELLPFSDKDIDMRHPFPKSHKRAFSVWDSSQSTAAITATRSRQGEPSFHCIISDTMYGSGASSAAGIPPPRRHSSTQMESILQVHTKDTTCLLNEAAPDDVFGVIRPEQHQGGITKAQWNNRRTREAITHQYTTLTSIKPEWCDYLPGMPTNIQSLWCAYCWWNNHHVAFCTRRWQRLDKEHDPDLDTVADTVGGKWEDKGTIKDVQFRTIARPRSECMDKPPRGTEKPHPDGAIRTRPQGSANTSGQGPTRQRPDDANVPRVKRLKLTNKFGK